MGLAPHAPAETLGDGAYGSIFLLGFGGRKAGVAKKLPAVPWLEGIDSPWSLCVCACVQFGVGCLCDTLSGKSGRQEGNLETRDGLPARSFLVSQGPQSGGLLFTSWSLLTLVSCVQLQVGR